MYWIESLFTKNKVKELSERKEKRPIVKNNDISI